MIFRDAFRHYNAIRRDIGLAPFTGKGFDFPKQSELFLQGCTPSFEYPRTDMPANVRWIGASIPRPPDNWQRPVWWRDLDGKRVVLVTQGTVNNNYDQLIRPAIRALASEDVLVVVTTGSGRPSDVAIEPLPASVRVEQFIPYGELMPRVDVLLTNGGYGTVQIALANGVPIVAFGKTEEKPEIANRLTYSGAGIGVKVLVPTESQIRDAVRRVLSDGAFRSRAREIAKEMAGLDAPHQAAQLIERLLAR